MQESKKKKIGSSGEMRKAKSHSSRIMEKQNEKANSKVSSHVEKICEM